jgi:hypothetical protein
MNALSRSVVLASVVVLALASGCSHVVTFTTNPPGARTTVNGIDLGPTPVSMTDEASTGKTFVMSFKKEGFKDKNVVLIQEANGARIALSVIGGLLCLIPFIGLLWGWELKQEVYNFDLEPGGEAPVNLPPPNM